MKNPALVQASGLSLKFPLPHWRRRRCWRSAAMTAARVNDDAGAFPRLNKSLVGIRAVELQSQVVHVAHQFRERGGVRFHFLQERAAIDDLAARRAHDIAEFSDGYCE